jgi:hypothetical protein
MAGVAWARSAGGTARRDHELIPIGDSWNPLETSSARGDRLEPKVRIELTAYALPRRCSTTELLGHAGRWYQGVARRSGARQ